MIAITSHEKMRTFKHIQYIIIILGSFAERLRKQAHTLDLM